MIVIGITGRSQNGKSTAAKAVSKEAASGGLAPAVFELSHYVLADAIRQGRIEPSKTRADCDDADVKQLVLVGMERRSRDPDYWVRILAEDISAKNPDVALVPNLRFLNEAAMIRQLGGSIVRVVSYVVDGVEYISRDRDANHVSEIEHYSINADYFLVTKRGEPGLLSKQAATLFNHLKEMQ